MGIEVRKFSAKSESNRRRGLKHFRAGRAAVRDRCPRCSVGRGTRPARHRLGKFRAAASADADFAHVGAAHY
jgi:hypothetical protein